MPSTYTTNLRLTLPTDGELSGTWGSTVNTGVTALLETAISGRGSVAMADADYTLTTANGSADEARNMVVRMTGALTANRNVICPTAAKLYLFENATTGGFALTLKTAAGSGISVANGTSAFLRCDATNVVNAFTALPTTPAGTLPIANGGTGSTTAAAARTALGSTTVGDAVFIATTAAAARTAISSPPRATRIDIASVAGTVDLTTNAPDTDDIQITGTNAITAFTVAVGRVLRVTAGGAFTLANNGSIVTQTGATIVCVSGDTFMLRATAANVVEVFGYAAVLGNYEVPRTWQDMSASRASATGYTNSTGREIEVSITSAPATATDCILTVSGIQIARSSQNSSGGNSCVYGKVPNGATYSCVIVGSPFVWAELR